MGSLPSLKAAPSGFNSYDIKQWAEVNKNCFLLSLSFINCLKLNKAL
jgi:hypothetical protein